MDTHDRQFHPENVDADIDQFLQIHDPEEIAAQANVRFIHEMSDLYLEESQVLDRAWKRLSQQMPTSTQQKTFSVRHYQKQRGITYMQGQLSTENTRKQRPILKRLSTVALGLVAALIVTSMIFSITAYQRSHMSSTKTAATHATTSTSQVASSTRIVAGPAANIITSLTATVSLYSNTGKSATGKSDILFPHTTQQIFTSKTLKNGQIVHLTYTVNSVGQNGHIYQKIYPNYHAGSTQPAFMSVLVPSNVNKTYSNELGVVIPQYAPLKVELWWNNQLAQTAYINVP
ncbi:hypothetical protein ccbrp13_03060 [Ktedonobacteria bacterium brp13]|nr:hypothetical protein ccbrp13_03060 [Ktedonobacteria bacterium brp13]